ALTVGPAAKLTITTQATGPAADGGRLTAALVAVQDLYGNATTSTASITAAPVQSTWTLGGTTTIPAVSGTASFTDLTAFSTGAVSGVTISFSSGGLTSATNTPFNIPAPILANLTGTTLAGGKLKFTFTNPTGLSFSVLGTNDI